MNSRLVGLRSRDERGNGVLQAVIVFPVILTAITTILQFALWYYASSVVDSAAHEAVQTARSSDGTVDEATARAQSFLAQTGGSTVVAPQIAVSRDNNQANADIRASVIGILPMIQLPIHAVAHSRIERFYAPDGS